MKIRTIQPNDNASLASIIRKSLTEFTDSLENTVYDDPTTDDLFKLFSSNSRAIYYVAEDDDGKVLGGGGLYPSDGLEEGTVELVKMYLDKSARGKGIGKTILQKSIASAQSLGYDKIYIETIPALKAARRLYEGFGWKYIGHSLGNTGHTGCDMFMLLEI